MVNTPTPASPNPSGDAQSMEKLKQSAGYIIGIIGLALAGYFGWNYIQNSNLDVDTVAADKYEAIEKTNESIMLSQDPNAPIDAEAVKGLNADIDALVSEHGESIYAWQALMIKARVAADANDFATAEEALKRAMAIELGDPGLRAITQLRYASALLAAGNLDDAMTQASLDVPAPFEASQQELFGDIYLAQADKESAIRSYQNAWSMLAKRSEERGILRLKLENLGVNPEPIEPKPAVVTQAPAPTMSAGAADDASVSAAAQESEDTSSSTASDESPADEVSATDNAEATEDDSSNHSEDSSTSK